ncbi:MAG: hypothetical protein HDT44_11015 [Ruminococcaceae bacterium]|nr:hypothetical protein [Oscillospiraceae bacterium]
MFVYLFLPILGTAEGTAQANYTWVHGKGLTDMYGVNSGVNFPNSYYGKNTKSQGVHDQHKTPETKTPGRKDEILFSSANRKENGVAGLSDEAKSLLAELKEKYKNYDFMIADYKTDEEADQLLSQGKGEYNVLITPDLLEKMASDKSERAKYEDIIAGASEQFSEIEKNLTEDGKSIVDKLGFTVKEDGTVDYYAKLINGVTSNNGKSVKASLADELSNMVNKIAENRAKAIEEAKKRHEDFKVEKNPNEVKDPYNLSDGAKAVLRELIEKYDGYDFIVGKWETDEEASRVLSYGMGREGNVLINPDLLEEMAADESVKAKYMGIIDDAKSNLDKAEKSLSNDGRSVVEKLGLTIGADGSISYFAKLAGGVTTDDGGDYIKCAIIEDLTKSLEAIAETQKKVLEKRGETDEPRLRTPEEKKKKVEHSVMPPKSFEKYEKEKKPYSTEEDFGNLPPESFKKYQSEADTHTGDKGDKMNFSV